MGQVLPSSGGRSVKSSQRLDTPDRRSHDAALHAGAREAEGLRRALAGLQTRSRRAGRPIPERRKPMGPVPR